MFFLPMDLIYMNYWSDKQWLFWLINDNQKELLFDGVLENHTDHYEGSPENTNYIKYVIYPPVSLEDKLKNED